MTDYWEVKWSEGACTPDNNTNNVNFYPEPSGGFVKQVNLAKALCATCPIKLDCLAYGMTEEFGIWGGLTAEERKGNKKNRIYAAPSRERTEREIRLREIKAETNRRRAIEQAPAAIARLKTALLAVAHEAPPSLVEAAQLRIDNPTLSMTEVASLANLSKDTYTGRIRRLMNLYEASK